MAGTLTVSGLAAGLASGEKIVGPLTMTGSQVIGEIRDLVLASGANAVPVPAGAAAVALVFPQFGSVALTVRTNLNGSDAGLPLGASGYAVFPLATGVVQLVINAAGACAIEATFI
jgi:hypothetical protein